jgi:uncharacterized glyoxalase superfamily protein PhnB
MTAIRSITLESADVAAAERFYSAVFGADSPVRVRAAEEPSSGFRAFTLSLVVSQPANVHALVDAALAAGATELKPVKKTFWGVGGVLRAPDGAIWKIATSNKKDTAPPSTAVDQVVLLLGATDVAASKEFYTGQGLAVAKSFGRKYVEFAAADSPVTLALYGHRALAKDAGVPPEGSGSHRLVIGTDDGTFTDPDGFPWQQAA